MSGHKSPEYSKEQIEEIRTTDETLYQKGKEKKVKRWKCPNCGKQFIPERIDDPFDIEIYYKPYCKSCRIPLVFGEYYMKCR